MKSEDHLKEYESLPQSEKDRMTNEWQKQHKVPEPTSWATIDDIGPFPLYKNINGKLENLD